MQDDPELLAVAMIADDDGVSMAEVAARGRQDLAARLAVRQIRRMWAKQEA